MVIATCLTSLAGCVRYVSQRGGRPRAPTSSRARCRSSGIAVRGRRQAGGRAADAGSAAGEGECDGGSAGSGVVVLAAVLFGVGVAAGWPRALAAKDAVAAGITWAVMAFVAVLSQLLLEPFLDGVKDSLPQ